MIRNNLLSFLKKQKKLILVASMLIVGSVAFADIADTTDISPDLLYDSSWHAIIALSGGAAMTSSLDQSQTIPIRNPITDEFFIYQPNGNSQTKGMFDGFLGAEWRINPNWDIQFGVNYERPATFHVGGTLIQGADVPSEDQFTYDYQVRTWMMLAEGKLLYNWRYNYHPYFLLGLGAGFNKASGFTTNVPPLLTFTRNYGDNRTTSFAYKLGLGLDVDMAQYVRLGVGYRFANAGKFELGRANINNVEVPGTLSQSHLYINEILAQITFVI